MMLSSSENGTKGAQPEKGFNKIMIRIMMSDKKDCGEDGRELINRHT
jgi:hypothetical protein